MTSNGCLLTEPEAWREVARRFAARETTHGLCWEVQLLAGGGLYRDNPRLVDREVQETMEERLLGYLNESVLWEYRPDDRYSERHSRHRPARALAALWLALEAEENPTP